MNLPLFRLYANGMSQRACAEILGVRRATVARKLTMLGKVCRRKNARVKPRVGPTATVVFDEMETFEHTKCKPVSIAIAVEEKTRHILSVHVSKMPAKGRLARIAWKRYGYRRDMRKRGLTWMMKDLKKRTKDLTTMKSDECPRYPIHVLRHFPDVNHERFKGRRACVVGQGEMKAGGFDPLFSLNHTCAMNRDHIKRLARKTWCTIKKRQRLQDFLDIYARYHNAKIAGKKRLVRF